MDAAVMSHPAARREENSGKIGCPALFWLFCFGSIAGFVLEGLWCILTKGHWENHSATVWGPFCIIYGIGAVAVYLLSIPLQRKGFAVQFAAFTISGTVVEYLGSLLQELCLGSVSWDYSAHALNLGGRVSLKMALMWGVLGIAFLRLVFPFLGRLLKKLNGGVWRIACVGMAVFMLVNLLTSVAAVSRWRARMQGIEATSAAAQWLDDTYDDQTMRKLYPNMKFTNTAD